MSYLDLPRLHFAGVFVAQPSTVNNTPQNFDPNVTNPNPGWNPNGAAGWQFKNCTVRSVVYSEGRVCEGASEEAIIGSPVQGTDSPSVAKLVDLDSEQQMVSEIWGFQVVVGLPGGPDSVRGDFEVAAFADIWFRAVDAGQGGDAPMGASYQSVLKNLQWADTLRSPFLKELRKASPDRLSIKFNLDGINMDSTSPTFCQGRITGTIGPASADEPEHFVAARLLRSAPGTSTDPNLQPATLQGTPPASPMFFAPAKVDETRGRVVLDVGNSLSTTMPAGPPNPALGNLALALLPPEGPPALLGQIRYQLPGWYETTAGVQEFALGKKALRALTTARLGVVQVSGSGQASAPLLQENPDASFVRADRFVFRLNPGETAVVKLYATRYGRPASRQLITLRQDADSVNNMQSPPNPPNIPVGVPASALQFPASVKTDSSGRASFKLTATDPKNPRGFIDGQVYGVRYVWGEAEPGGYNHNPTSFVSVLVFNSYPQPDAPKWADVQPIFAQYAKLYPFMTNNVVNLADYSAVKGMLDGIKRVLNLPPTDPRYMQVTRDLSRDKLKLINRWIEQGAPQ